MILKKSDFVIHSPQSEDKKDKDESSEEEELDSENEELKNSAEDQIEDIICCTNSIPMNLGTTKNGQENVVLKIKHKENKAYWLLYNLEEGKEVTGLTGSRESDICFDSEGEFILTDPQMGLINLKTKEVLHEYHIDLE